MIIIHLMEKIFRDWKKPKVDDEKKIN